MKRILFSIISLVILTDVSLRAAENAPMTDFKSFHIIADRNIFNASRSGQRPMRSRTGRGPNIESFKLVGTLSYEKGRFAFFDGSSQQWRRTAQTEEVIAGYKLADIGPNSVKLTTTNGVVIDLVVGMQMRRQDNGPWSLSSRSEPVTMDSTSPATASAAPGDAENDVLKRLMQKRQELTK